MLPETDRTVMGGIGMRSMFALSTVILILVIGCSSASSGSDRVELSKDSTIGGLKDAHLIGSWVPQGAEEEFQMEFLEDHSYVATITGGSDSESLWVVTDDSHVRIGDSDIEATVAGDTLTMVISRGATTYNRASGSEAPTHFTSTPQLTPAESAEKIVGLWQPTGGGSRFEFRSDGIAIESGGFATGENPWKIFDENRIQIGGFVLNFTVTDYTLLLIVNEDNVNAYVRDVR